MNVSFKFFLILYMEIYENFIHLFSHSTLTYVHKRSEILNICLTQVFCDSLHRQIKKVLRDS